MRIVPFPQRNDPDLDVPVAELEAALTGDSRGPTADSWRELREDVRMLAPPISPEFERRLRERIEEHAARGPRRAKMPWQRAVVRARKWLHVGWRPRVVAGLGVAMSAALVAALILAPWRAASPPERTPAVAQSGTPARSATGAGETSGGLLTQTAPVPKRASTAPSIAAAGPSVESAPARVQQRGASITLAAASEGVQSIADRVARLAVGQGGFVQSSQVHLQRDGASEAALYLSLPSARLSVALALLAQLAPTRAESQSLQDITDEYDAARRRLADATAERQALLRALAKASTQGEIESLRARLSLAGGAIARAHSALQAVAKRGSSSPVEVTVVGDTHGRSEGLTLKKGLRDVGDVLTVALVVLIIAIAVLVPLSILLALLLIGWRVSRRVLRERALS
jgi:hypothetical protein